MVGPNPPSAVQEVEPSDEELLRTYTDSKDREALSTVFARHSSAAYRLARRITRSDFDAEDAVQAAFLRILRGSAIYRGEGQVKTWLMGIVVNASRNSVRERTRRTRRENNLAQPQKPRALNPENCDKAAIQTAFDQLPELYRLPLWLHYFEQMPTEEVAAALQRTPTAVRTQLMRGLGQLRTVLARSGYAVAAPVLPGLIASISAEPVPPSLTAALAHIVETGQVPAGTVVSNAAATSGRVAAAAKPVSVAGLAVIGTVLFGGIAAGILWWMPRNQPPVNSAAAGQVLPGRPMKILRQFDAPLPDLQMLLYDGSLLWVRSAGDTGRIYKLDADTGAVLEKITLTVLQGASMPSGKGQLSADHNGNINIFDSVSGEIYRLNKTTGVISLLPHDVAVSELKYLTSPYFGTKGFTLFNWDPTGGKKVPLDIEPGRGALLWSNDGFVHVSNLIYKFDVEDGKITAAYKLDGHRVINSVNYGTQTNTLWLLVDSDRILLVDLGDR